jgi:hypothetical protein
MRLGSSVALILAAALAAPAAAGERAGKKPRLDLRASPRFSLLSANVLVVAQLVGGDDVEELHCPAVEWEWGDGERSAHESDCAPFEPGTTMERRHSASHAYRRPGEYSVRVTLRRAGRSVASASTAVTIGGGASSDN